MYEMQLVRWRLDGVQGEHRRYHMVSIFTHWGADLKIEQWLEFEPKYYTQITLLSASAYQGTPTVKVMCGEFDHIVYHLQWQFSSNGMCKNNINIANFNM
jgi:hypothetical protein